MVHNLRLSLYLRRFVVLKQHVTKTFSTRIQHIERFDRDSPCEHYLNLLRTTFEHNNFKPLQWAVIQSIIENRQDNYVCLPTGYGKSLCYQYPAVYSNGLSIVISPLISLMQNQVKSLEDINVPSCFISSLQDNKQEIVEKLLNNYYRLLYITPESALNPKGLRLLKRIYEKVKISLIAVDEAQCILHWGRGFRPSYEKLHEIKTLMPQIPIMALTASTTFKEKEIIIQKLGLRNVQYVHEDLNRENLYFIVKKMSKEPYGDILNVLTHDIHKYNVAEGSIIIYCLTKKAVAKIVSLLNSMRINCQAYHSGLNIFERTEALDNFMNDKVKIIVATTAFGLGVHKSDVRCVIHYGTSLNMENYFQEVGRAGRDGQRALCVLFYSISDFSTHRYLDKNKKFKNDNTMKKYIMTAMCRRKFILSHFEESFERESQFETDCCDICTNNLNSVEIPSFDCTAYVEKFLQTIKSLQPQSYGIKSVIHFLLGSKKKVFVNMSVNNKYFGMGSDKSEDWWNQLALIMEIEKYIKISSISVGSAVYSKVSIDEKGKYWLKHRNDGIIIPIILKISNDF